MLQIKEFVAWGDGSVGKIPASETEGPEPAFSMPIKKLDMMMHRFLPQAREVRTGRSLDYIGQPALLDREILSYKGD